MPNGTEATGDRNAYVPDYRCCGCSLASESLAQTSSLGRPCTAAPEIQWFSKESLKPKAKAQGFKVRKVKIDDACGEVYALDQNDNETELSSMRPPARSWRGSDPPEQVSLLLTSRARLSTAEETMAKVAARIAELVAT